MVEQEAVNFEVASSSLASRAKEKHPCKGVFFFGSLGPAPNGNPNDFSRWKVASSLIPRGFRRKRADYTLVFWPPEPSNSHPMV